MTKFEEVKQALSALITDKTSPEQAEQIGRINNLVEAAEKEEQEIISAHEELRSKYVKVIKETGFPTPVKKEDPKPVSFEETLMKEINKK